MSLHRIFHSFILLITCAYASGQEPSYKFIPPQYELEHLKLNNKHDLGEFNDITEDKQGYLWLSSSKGLHVFDGNHTVTYKNGNSQYMLATDSVSVVLYSFANTGNANFWIQEENSRMLLFDPVKRKLVESFTNQAVDNELIFYTATSDDGSSRTAIIKFIFVKHRMLVQENNYQKFPCKEVIEEVLKKQSYSYSSQVSSSIQSS